MRVYSTTVKLRLARGTPYFNNLGPAHATPPRARYHKPAACTLSACKEVQHALSIQDRRISAVIDPHRIKRRLSPSGPMKSEGRPLLWRP
jgi:hypothetical protein